LVCVIPAATNKGSQKNEATPCDLATIFHIKALKKFPLNNTDERKEQSTTKEGAASMSRIDRGGKGTRSDCNGCTIAKNEIKIEQ
jgi:hypothetical protein